MALLGGLAAFLIAAPLLRIPYPILLVLGGLALGFVPGVPGLALPPDVVLVAVVAAVSGTFSIWDASWRFAWAVLGGVAIGIAVGFVVAEVRRRVDNPPVEVTISLISGYLAFIPAAAASASGVIAVVTAGVYL